MSSWLTKRAKRETLTVFKSFGKYRVELSVNDGHPHLALHHFFNDGFGFRIRIFDGESNGFRFGFRFHRTKNK